MTAGSLSLLTLLDDIVSLTGHVAFHAERGLSSRKEGPHDHTR